MKYYELKVTFFTHLVIQTRMLLRKTFHQNYALFTQVLSTANVNTGHRKFSSTNNENFKGQYDIIVAGGGMVGCTLACSLGGSDEKSILSTSSSQI